MNSSNTDSVNLEHARKTKKKKKKKKSKTLIVKATEEIFSRAEAEANYKNIDKQDITDTGTERLDNSGSEDNDISQQEANDQSTSTNVKLSDSFEYMEPKNEIPVVNNGLNVCDSENFPLDRSAVSFTEVSSNGICDDKIASEEFPLASAIDSAVAGQIDCQKVEILNSGSNEENNFLGSSSRSKLPTKLEEKTDAVFQGVKKAAERSKLSLQRARIQRGRIKRIEDQRKQEIILRKQLLDQKLRQLYKRRNLPTDLEERRDGKPTKQRNSCFLAALGGGNQNEIIKSDRDILLQSNKTKETLQISSSDVISTSVKNAAFEISSSAEIQFPLISEDVPILAGSLPEPQKNNVEGNIILLDVGGREFSTLKKTVQKYRSALIDRHIRGEEQSTWTANGALFFDADPDCFDIILHWYRSGQVRVKNTNDFYQKLLFTADFFLVRHLMFPRKPKEFDCGLAKQTSQVSGGKGFSFGTQKRFNEYSNVNSSPLAIPRGEGKSYKFSFNNLGFSSVAKFTVPKKSNLHILKVSGFGRLLVDVHVKGKYSVKGAVLYDSNLYFWKQGADVSFAASHVFPGGYKYEIFLAKPNADSITLRLINVKIETKIIPLYSTEEQPRLFKRGEASVETSSSKSGLERSTTTPRLPIIDERHNLKVRTGFF